MKKKSLLIIPVIIVIVLSVGVINRIDGIEYNLGEVTTDEWIFSGGYISIEGLQRQHELSALKYIGKERLEVQKMTIEVKTESLLGLLPDESITLSSIGGDEKWIIENGFEYGGVGGETHGIDARSYFLSGVKLHLIFESEDGMKEQYIRIPFLSFS